MAECFCDMNAHALKGSCECEEDCQCDCDVCGCEDTNLWAADLKEDCACGDGHCSCGEAPYETKQKTTS